MAVLRGWGALVVAAHSALLPTHAMLLLATRVLACAQRPGRVPLLELPGGAGSAEECA